MVLPGVLGSELCDRDGSLIWTTSPTALLHGMLTGGAAIKRLQLPPDIGDGPAPDGVVARTLMPDFHVLGHLWTVSVGYDGLLSWFRSNFETVEADPADPDRVVNFVPFPYDWRLSNRHNAQVLRNALDPILERYREKSGHPEAKFIFVAHSMGGLVARYFVDVLGGRDRTRAIVTLGTPHRGALNALEQLVNGARAGFGPVGLELTALARSLPSLYQLLPEYACIEGPGGSLLKTTECEVPQLDKTCVADAMAFHDELAAGMRDSQGSYESFPIMATTQPTLTTARIENGRVSPLLSIEDRLEQGDGTVPRLSAAPYGVSEQSPLLHYVSAQHGHLPADDAARTEVKGFLTGRPVIARAVAKPIGLLVPDVSIAGEPLDIVVQSAPDQLLEAELTRFDQLPMGSIPLAPSTQVAGPPGTINYRGCFDALAPGGYYLSVSAVGGVDGDRVTKPIFVGQPEAT